MARQFVGCMTLLFVFGAVALAANETEEDALTILFTNNTNGEVDPCGCVRNQRGGVGRRSTIVRYVRGKIAAKDEVLEKVTNAKDLLGDRRNVLLLDGGDFLFRGVKIPERLREQSSLRAHVMVSAYNRMAYDAVNVGAYDLIMGFAELKRLSAEANFPFLSSNLIDRKTGQPMFKRYMRKRVGRLTVGLFGLVTRRMRLRELPGGGHELAEIQDPLEITRQLVEELRPKCDLLIVLASMTLDEQKDLAAKVPGIDLMLGGHGDPRSRISYETDPAVKVGRTYIVQTCDGGRLMAMISLVIRNRSLDFVDVSERPEMAKMKVYLDELVSKVDSGEDTLTPQKKLVFDEMQRQLTQYAEQRKAAEQLMRTGDKSFIFVQMPSVLKAITPSEPIEDMILTYKERVARLNTEKARTMPEPVVSYMGQEFCSGCHKKQAEAWKKTLHASAFQALIDVKQELNPECIKCHTTGYDKKGGFVRVIDAPLLANVQCEVCHGRGEPEHWRNVDNPAPTRPLDCDTCKQCHTREQSPNFDCQATMGSVCAKD